MTQPMTRERLDEIRFVTCGLCEGSGEQIMAKITLITSGSLEPPAEYALPYPVCDGTGKMEQVVEPITLEDLE